MDETPATPDGAAGVSPPPRPSFLPPVGSTPLPGDPPLVPPATTPEPPARPPARRGSFLRELPVLVAVALVLALLIKNFALQAFYIPSGSMQQTLELQDRVLVNKLVYRFGEIQRGDIVVFNGLDNFEPEPTIVAPPANALQRALRAVSRALGVGPPGSRDFIKRVIAVEGDRVACCTDGRVTVTPAGSTTPVVLQEDYLFEDDQRPFCAAGTGPTSCPPGAAPVVVPQGRLWVMGDHRGASSDSRDHLGDKNGGTVPVDKVIGKAFVIVWPFDRSGGLDRPATFDQPALALPAGSEPLTPVPGDSLVWAAGLALPGWWLVRLRRRSRSA